MFISKNELKRKLKLYKDGAITSKTFLDAAQEYYCGQNAAKPHVKCQLPPESVVEEALERVIKKAELNPIYKAGLETGFRFGAEFIKVKIAEGGNCT